LHNVCFKRAYAGTGSGETNRRINIEQVFAPAERIVNDESGETVQQVYQSIVWFAADNDFDHLPAIGLQLVKVVKSNKPT
jgi:hypothetical protein